MALIHRSGERLSQWFPFISASFHPWSAPTGSCATITCPCASVCAAIASNSVVKRPLISGGSQELMDGLPVPRSSSHHSHRRWCCGAEKQSQTNHAAPVQGVRQCVKQRIALGVRRSESVFINPGRRHRWLIPHPSSNRSNADCRPLLQQSSPNRGRVVQPGIRAA
jgi:hypothetical protein